MCIILITTLALLMTLGGLVYSLDLLNMGETIDTRITTAMGESSHPASVTEANGTVHMVWQDYRTGNFEIFYNTIQGNGIKTWPNDLQLTTSVGDSLYPSIAIDAKGNLHVVWQDNRDGNWEIYYKKLDNTGLPITGDERVTNDSHNSVNPVVTVDADNNVHVTWSDDRTGTYELYGDIRVEPDLCPGPITITPQEPLVGQQVQVQVPIQNLGGCAASLIQVEFLVDNHAVSNQTMSLNAHATQTLTFLWIGTLGVHNITILVDPMNLIAENNEDNNLAVVVQTIYLKTTFNNPSIWADATIWHHTDLSATITSTLDPEHEGTYGNISQFVNFTTNNPFDHAQIRIGYTHEQLGYIIESSLKMYYWDSGNILDPWIEINDSGVNTVDNYVWANVTYLSIFAPRGTPEAPFLFGGYCYYQTMSPANNLTVSITNLNTHKQWNILSSNASDYFTLELRPGKDINASETLRILVKDNTSYIKLTNHTITQQEITTGGVNIEMILDQYYRDLKTFPSYSSQGPDYHKMSGPAVLQMMLNYMWWNSSQYQTPQMIFSNQTWLYNKAHINNSNLTLSYLDSRGMWKGVMELLPKPYTMYGYNFNRYHNTNQQILIKLLAEWIDYTIGTYGGHKPGYPFHVPGAIPAYGDYSNWMAVRGIHTNHSAYPLPSALTIYGFWLNDPYPTGIGENSYKTITEFSTLYYRPLTGISPQSEYYNEYIALCEPPETRQDCVITYAPQQPLFTPVEKYVLHQLQVKTIQHLPLNDIAKEQADQWVIDAAIKGLQTQLLPYDPEFSAVYDQTIPGVPIFIINLHGEGNYYAVPFILRNNDITPYQKTTPTMNPLITKIVVLVNAENGSFKETSWVKNPVRYLPLSKTEAQQRVLDKLKELGIVLKDPTAMTCDLVYRQSSSYDPEWRITIKQIGKICFVSQDGTITFG